MIPCWSHFASCPFASVVVWPAVGAAFSTGSLSIFDGLPDDDVEDEFEFEEPDLNLLVRLQAATTNTKATSKKTCFIGSPNFSGIDWQTPFTLTRRRCQMILLAAWVLTRKVKNKICAHTPEPGGVLIWFRAFFPLGKERSTNSHETSTNRTLRFGGFRGSPYRSRESLRIE